MDASPIGASYDVDEPGDATPAPPASEQEEPAPAHGPVPEEPEEPARFEALEVPGFLDAVVSWPGGPPRRHPVMLATHGAGGAPEHHCEAWRHLLGKRGIVVCPRGAMINRIHGPDAGFYYPDHHALEREVVATVDAFRARHAARIDADTMLYAGYSQGATMGALILPEHAQVFPRVVLIEGGFSEWNLGSARKFAAAGGKRVLFVCGVKSCKRGADRSAHSLRRAELAVETRLADGAGHTYLGPVAQQIAEGFAWLVSDDPRWR